MFAKRTIVTISIFVSAILVISTFYSIPARAAATAGADWFGQEGNYPFNYNYNPQTTLNTNNAQQLALTWAFPIPSAPATDPSGSDGVVVTPMILNGIAYFVTDWNGVFAVDAHDGKIIWTKTLPFNTTSPTGFKGQAAGSGHFHGIWNTVTVRGGNPLVWIAAQNYTVYALNALTGDINLKFNPLTRAIANTLVGNFGSYNTLVNNIVIDDKRGILIAGSEGSENTNAARGWFEGFNINTTPPTLLWRSYIMPPQNGKDATWDIRSVANMTHAYLFDGVNQIDLKAMSATQINATLYGDWGTFGFNGTRSFTGANAAWGGSWAIDPSTGTAYVATAQVAPDLNGTFRPGPNLWSASIMSVDEQTGKFNWAFQTTAHDLGDYDCSWSVILANATINGQNTKTIFKGCKNGYFYALDAATGKMLWDFNPPSINRVGAGIITNHNPLNKTQMNARGTNYPKITPWIDNPPSTGGIESNPAYDPSANLAFVTSYNAPAFRQCADVGPTLPKGQPYGTTNFPCVGRVTVTKPPTFPNNATLWAIDVNTGKPVWHFDVSTVGFRGGISVSGGVVFLPTADGFLRLIDEHTGKLLNPILIGAAMITQAAIGQDASGNTRVIVPVSTSSRVGLLTGTGISTPGYIAALSLPASLPVQTSTSVTTVSAVVTSTVQGPTSGIDPTTFYGVAGLAAIFVIATGVLTVRRRKPAS